jgi:WW domain-containing oxidoreductase
MVSSNAHNAAPKQGIELDNLSGEKRYRSWRAYGQSKLANMLFAKELARRLQGRATANAVHPGVIKTNLARHMAPAARLGLAIAEPLFLKTPEQGAATQCYVAVHPSAAGITGEYFVDCNVARPSTISHDRELAARLWRRSEEIDAALP